MPSGFKTLGQVAWTSSLGVEGLRKKVVRLRPSKKWEGKDRGWERENWWLLISWVQSLRSLYLLWVLCPGFPESFQRVSPFLEVSWGWAPLNCDSDIDLDPSRSLNTSKTQTEAPVCFSTITSETLYFFNENRVCRPPNTVHQHPGQENPKCDLVFAWSGLTDSWTTPSIYTACARPILSFPRSKTKKYTLRKMSPSIQVFLDILTMLTSKVV